MAISMLPKVSVCMPVYNGSDYIAESIESVLSQTYKDFDLIVSDNCSTDKTEDIVRSYHDPRLKYFRNTKNLGQTGNVNRCLELADGEYVCIFHHDDIMLPDNLERKVRLLDEHPEVGFVHSNIMLIDPNGDIVDENIWVEDSRHDYIEEGLTIFRKYISFMPYAASIFIGAVLARRACYERVGGFSPEIPNCDDSEMWMRMLLFYNVACLGRPLVKYRVHPASASSMWGDYTSIANLKEHFQATSRIFNNYKDSIPDARELKKKVYSVFGERAIQLASSAMMNRDFQMGREFFKEAMRFTPSIVKKILFWKIAAGLLIGEKGIEQYKKIKAGKSN
jgi:glycosyltransferase involved in cell wall biosynthesis